MKSQPKAFQKWAAAHDQELVDSMANKRSPDLVALLADEVGFGRLGDHGGAQEKVQRIPMMIAGPGIKKGVDPKALRLVDLEALMTKAFALPQKPKP